jgi:hypothetical protein
MRLRRIVRTSRRARISSQRVAAESSGHHHSAMTAITGGLPRRPRSGGVWAQEVLLKRQGQTMNGRSPTSRRPSPEDRQLLETLVFYRGLYAERGPKDQEAVTSVASVIGAAELRMRALRIRDERMRRRFISG